ncbi:MAG TPA: potassium/proton antiporter [Nocardioides sp.]|uniref:potassium/proton antiporter n=1 Tax=Nocardioides sp. TaxID=35761 RepID=UPI002B50C476|nr:potassium/proton antiporter [Nocardioides sp.]HQR25426.1 potassium/proton antiporter [Nocardioides sp.]
MDLGGLNLVLLVGAVVLLAAVAAVRLSTRAGLPMLLLYLAIGVAIGEAGLGLHFEDAELTQLLGTIALAVILAEGGFTTDWRVVRPVAGLALVLATVGVAVSVLVTSSLVYLVLDVDVRTAIILGAVASSTDAAAVFAVLRRLPVRGRLRAVVEAESGFNDPPVIILVTVVTSSAWGEAGVAGVGGQVLYQLAAGVAIGFVVARAGVWVLVRSALPASGLYPIATLAIAFLGFAVAGLAGASGLMAIYVTGLTLGNAVLPHRATTSSFVEGLAWLSQIGLFIMLGLLASPSRLWDALPFALVVGSALTLVARPVSVLVCATPFRMPWREQAFVSWAGLRGAVPIVLATIPMSLGLPGATRIFDVVFLLVVLFTLIQGPTLPAVARRLGVAEGGATRELAVESAPLEALNATLLQLAIPRGSRLAGVEIAELRLPRGTSVSMLLRGGEILTPAPTTVLRSGDHLLVATPRQQRDAVERRLAEVSRSGRLAGWYAALSGPASSSPGMPTARGTPVTRGVLRPGGLVHRATGRGSEGEGAFGENDVHGAVGGPPVVAAVAEAFVPPAAVRLGSVMAPAQRSEILRDGLTGRSGVVVGDDVVEVAASGVPMAVGEDAVGIAEPDQLGQPGGRVVGVHPVGARQVQDRLDADAGALEPPEERGEGGRTESLGCA